MSATEESEPRAGGVSTLELFFDLVFVFTLTQLTSVLADEPSWKGLLQVSVMLGVIFWMYGGYAWLTNSVVVDRLTRRLTLLGGMAGFLVVALAVPGAFEGSGTAFGLAYLAVVLVHLGMFAVSSRLTVKQAILGLAPFNLSSALLVLVGGILGGTAQYVLWTAAFALAWLSPKLIDSSGFVIEPGHFVERHGLVVIVAIGESIIAVGIGAAGLPVDAGLVAAAVLGLALSACLWWSYFGSDEGVAEERMEAAPMAARPRLAIHAFGYWHLLIL
ncbi:MAG: low temperature requirement protein A, partial [Chloroflexota bacterium]|nr:low temperature requirement protein A [Chloroflexota bacterium]